MTKMKIKTWYVRFFKDSLNKIAVTPTLELVEGNISAFANFEYKQNSLKTEESLKNKHDFLLPFYKVIQPFELDVRLMLKCDQLEEEEGLIFVRKGLKPNWHQGGGGADKL